MWTDSGLINTGILAVTGLVTLILQRVFSKKDTITTTVFKELARSKRELAWQRQVINLADQEVWQLRHIMSDSGLELKPRPVWPPYPTDDDGPPDDRRR